MSEANFASLGPTLLARKGGAKPAMRPQLGALSQMALSEGNVDDLGWNDMGEDGETPAHRPTDTSNLTPLGAVDSDAGESQDAEDGEPAGPAFALHGIAANEDSHDAPAEHDFDDEEGEEGDEDEPFAVVSPLPQQPAVLRQREEAAERVAQPAPSPLLQRKPAEAEKPAEPARKRRSALGRGKRAAFTLRLDEQRHIKLRLACTIRNRSAQQIVTEALDALLSDIDELDSLAERVKRR